MRCTKWCLHVQQRLDRDRLHTTVSGRLLRSGLQREMSNCCFWQQNMRSRHGRIRLSARLHWFHVRASLSRRHVRSSLQFEVHVRKWCRMPSHYRPMPVCARLDRLQLVSDLKPIFTMEISHIRFYSLVCSTVPCPDGSYGPNCSQLCKCKNGARCRKK